MTRTDWLRMKRRGDARHSDAMRAAERAVREAFGRDHRLDPPQHCNCLCVRIEFEAAGLIGATP